MKIPFFRNVSSDEIANASSPHTSNPEHVRAPSQPPRDAYTPPSEWPSSLKVMHEQNWSAFSTIPPHLRTWLTHAMLYVQHALDFLTALRPEDLRPDLQEKLLPLGSALEKIVDDLRSPFLENHSLSLLGLERLQNELIRQDQGTAIRLSLNMTEANKVDPSGNLGTAFKQAVLEWLQWSYGLERVSLNPEGTSFLIIKEGRGDASLDFEQFLRAITFRLEQRGMQQKFRYDASLLDHFKPDAFIAYLTVDARELSPRKAIRSNDREIIHAMQAQLLALSERSLRILAVGGTILEKAPWEFGLESGMRVYDANFLLGENVQRIPAFQHALDLGTGYVPASVFIPKAFFPDDLPSQVLLRHPRYRHDIGRIDHRARQGDPGGALQQMLASLTQASTAQSEEARIAAIRKLRTGAQAFSQVLQIGWKARGNPRNPLRFEKWTQQLQLHDGSKAIDSYFIERVALLGDNRVHLAVSEVDSFKAFSQTYPVDDADGAFWEIFESYFLAAEALGVKPPLLAQVAGDLIVAAIPTMDQEGQPVLLEEFMTHVQSLVFHRYRDRPFQDYAKVEQMIGGSMKVERLPLWLTSQASSQPAAQSVVATARRPDDASPFMRSLTISWVGTTIHTPRTMKAVQDFPHIVDDLATQVEHLKEKSAPSKGCFRLIASQISLTPEPPTVRVTGTEPLLAHELQAPAAQQLIQNINQQFYKAWTPHIWENVDPQFKAHFFHRLFERLHTAPPILRSHEVSEIFRNVSTGMSRPLPSLPAPPALFLPMIPTAISPLAM